MPSRGCDMPSTRPTSRQRRAVRDTRQRVWLRLTETGRSAYRGHVAALHHIVGNAQAQTPERERLEEPGTTPAMTS
jgi:hypothetical protein